MSKPQYPISVSSDFDAQRGASGTIVERFREEARFSMVEILSVMFRHWRRVVTVFMVIISAVFYYTFWMMQETYTSEARILLRGVRGSLTVDPSNARGVSGEYMPTFRERARNELAILESRDLAQSVVATIGASKIIDSGDDGTVLAAAWDDVSNNQRPDSEEFAYAAVKTVMGGLSSEVNQGQVITLKYSSSSPDTAYRVLDAITHKYLERHMEIFQSSASPGFFEEEAGRIREELVKKEGELESFLDLNNLTDINAQKDEALARQREARRQSNDTHVRIQAAEALIQSLRSSLESRDREVEVSRSSVVNEDARRLNQQLLALELEAESLAVRYFEDNPELKRVRNQIALIEKRLAEQPEVDTEVTMALDTTREKFEQDLIAETANLAALKASKKSLLSELDDVSERVRFLLAVAPEALQLEREVNVLREKYENFQDSKDRAQVAASLDRNKTSNVSIFQAATKPFEPDPMNRMRNILLGAFVALFAGIGMAFISEYLDDSMKSSAEVEKRLEIPVLATIAYAKRL